MNDEIEKKSIKEKPKKMTNISIIKQFNIE
jgi:hypothetical protein